MKAGMDGPIMALESWGLIESSEQTLTMTIRDRQSGLGGEAEANVHSGDRRGGRWVAGANSRTPSRRLLGQLQPVD